MWSPAVSRERPEFRNRPADREGSRGITRDPRVERHPQKRLSDVSATVGFSVNRPDLNRPSGCHMTVLQQEDPAATDARARAHLQVIGSLL